MFEYNSFYLFNKWNHSILLIYKYINSILCVDFFLIRFFLIFLIMYSFTIRYFFDSNADFFPNFIAFFNRFSSFVKKDMHLVLSKSLLYALIFGKNMNKGLIFLASSQSINYLKSFLPKETSLDTTILLRSRLPTKMIFLCW